MMHYRNKVNCCRKLNAYASIRDVMKYQPALYYDVNMIDTTFQYTDTYVSA